MTQYWIDSANFRMGGCWPRPAVIGGLAFLAIACDDRSASSPMPLPAPAVASASHGAVAGLMTILDRDGDGTLTVAEASSAARRAWVIRRADKDGDGQLSSGELLQLVIKISPEVPGHEGHMKRSPPDPEVRRTRMRGWLETLRAEIDESGRWTADCPTANPRSPPPAGVAAPPTTTGDIAARTERPNIVLISVDGLRADRTPLLGHGLLTAPNIVALAEQGTHFPLAFSQSNESLFSHASIFTGRYPSEIAWPDYTEYIVPPVATTLPEMMVAGGYETAAFIGGGHVGAAFGFAQGFDRFFTTEEEFGSFHSTTPAALAWIDERSSNASPFFLFLHGYDLHRPYVQGSVFHHPFSPGARGPCERLDALLEKRNFSEYIYKGVAFSDFQHQRFHHKNGTVLLDPAQYTRLQAHGSDSHSSVDALRLAPEMIAHAQTHYDASVLAADTHVGLFLAGLKDRDLWDNTIVVLTSDHGEDLLDHGFFNHRAVVHDSTTRVPLILGGGALPAGRRGTVDTRLADAVDLLPTIADLVGMSAPAGVRGRSLWSPKAPEYTKVVFQSGVLGQSSARVGPYRLVFLGPALTDPEYLDRMAKSPIDGGRFVLFDIAADPAEQIDVVSRHPDQAEALRTAMVRWWSDMHLGHARQPLTDTQRDMLQRHGYW